MTIRNENTQLVAQKKLHRQFVP